MIAAIIITFLLTTAFWLFLFINWVFLPITKFEKHIDENKPIKLQSVTEEQIRQAVYEGRGINYN